MALNFWQSNGGIFLDKEALWRAPNPRFIVHSTRGCGLLSSRTASLSGPLTALHVGRKNPELFARLNELTSMLTMLGCSASPYSRVFTGYDVAKDNTQYPELEPYRDLDPSRLFLFGRGHWDVTEFLCDSLVMAYREPESIKVERDPAPWEYPRLRDPPETIAQLAKLWDSQGLLLLHRSRLQTRRSCELVRVFNCYKAIDRDRQIGDRVAGTQLRVCFKGLHATYLKARIFVI